MCTLHSVEIQAGLYKSSLVVPRRLHDVGCRTRPSDPDDIMGTVKLTYNGTRGHSATGRTLPTNASLDDWGFMCELANSLWCVMPPICGHTHLESDDANIYCCDSQLPRQ